jgi:hypothetical protein
LADVQGIPSCLRRESDLKLRMYDEVIYVDGVEEPFRSIVNYILEEKIVGFNSTRDSKMLTIAVQDLELYLSINFGKEVLQELLHDHKKVLTSRMFHEETGLWLDLWIKKWRERTQLLFSRDKYDTMTKGQTTIFDLKGYDYEEAMELISGELIRKGEICCVQILSSALLRRVVSQWSRPPNVGQLLSSIVRQVRDLRGIIGPVVYIKMFRGE